MSDISAFTGGIAANYDKLLGPYLFEPYALDLKDRLKNEECKMVLELACGTGRVTNHLKEVLSAGGKIIATDLNNDMIEVAKTKVNDSRIEWKVADAQAVPFEDELFDHVVCQFGVMFFPDKRKAFKEAYRVLDKKGRFIFNTWGSLNDNRRAGLVSDVIAEILNGEIPEFFSNGPYSFYDTGTIRNLLSDAGFTSISIEPVKKTVYYNTREDYLNGFIDGSTLSVFIQQKDPGLRELVKEKLNIALQREFGNSPESEMLAYVCSGRKD